jgi:hypothetical protein
MRRMGRVANASNDTSSATLVQLLRISISNDGVFNSLRKKLLSFKIRRHLSIRAMVCCLIP